MALVKNAELREMANKVAAVRMRCGDDRHVHLSGEEARFLVATLGKVERRLVEMAGNKPRGDKALA